MGIDAAAYRQVVGRLATGVTVLSTTGADGHEVMTANAVASVSLDPVLLLASVKVGSRWATAARAAGCFAVNVLSEGQEELSRWCSSPRRHDNPHEVLRHKCRTGPATGSLLFEESLASFECVLHSVHQVGDHELIVGEVREMWVPGMPLLFFQSKYAGMSRSWTRRSTCTVSTKPPPADAASPETATATRPPRTGRAHPAHKPGSAEMRASCGSPAS